MLTWLHSVKQNLNDATELAMLNNILVRVAEKLSCDFILYNIQISNSFDKSFFIVVGNYPDTWYQQYQAKDYAKIDPVLKHCIQRSQPILWHKLHDNDNPSLQIFFKEASQFGLVDGISKGARKSPSEVGIFSIARKSILNEESTDTSDILMAIDHLQMHIHDTMIRLSARYRENKGALLTPRESEALHLMVKGHTSVEIAQELDIVESTAVFHIKNIIEKLDAKNRIQAVARAVLIGLVSTSDYHDKQQHSYHWKDI